MLEELARMSPSQKFANSSELCPHRYNKQYKPSLERHSLQYEKDGYNIY